MNTKSYFQLPGLILEPVIFIMIAYWIAELRPTVFAFSMTAISSVLIMNVSTACGSFFSAAFNSVPEAMSYLIPFDYLLMITSGVFLKLNTLPDYFAWLPYLNWIMYGNEVMNIVQWDGITNISKSHFNVNEASFRMCFTSIFFARLFDCCVARASLFFNR